jgi:hypothetical protein
MLNEKLFNEFFPKRVKSAFLLFRLQVLFRFLFLPLPFPPPRSLFRFLFFLKRDEPKREEFFQEKHEEAEFLLLKPYSFLWRVFLFFEYSE